MTFKANDVAREAWKTIGGESAHALDVNDLIPVHAGGTGALTVVVGTGSERHPRPAYRVNSDLWAFNHLTRWQVCRIAFPGITDRKKQGRKRYEKARASALEWAHVLYLHFPVNLSAAAVAAEMGLTERQVEGIIDRARKIASSHPGVSRPSMERYR